MERMRAPFGSRKRFEGFNTTSELKSPHEVFAPNNFTPSGMRFGALDPNTHPNRDAGPSSRPSYSAAQPFTHFGDVASPDGLRFGGAYAAPPPIQPHAGARRVSRNSYVNVPPPTDYRDAASPGGSFFGGAYADPAPTQPTYGSPMFSANSNRTARQNSYDRVLAEVKASWSGGVNAASTQPRAATSLFASNPSTAAFGNTTTPPRSVFSVFAPPAGNGNASGAAAQPAFGSSLFSPNTDTATSNNIQTQSDSLFGVPTPPGMTLFDILELELHNPRFS